MLHRLAIGDRTILMVVVRTACRMHTACAISSASANTTLFDGRSRGTTSPSNATDACLRAGSCLQGSRLRLLQRLGGSFEGCWFRRHGNGNRGHRERSQTSWDARALWKLPYRHVGELRAGGACAGDRNQKAACDEAAGSWLGGSWYAGGLAGYGIWRPPRPLSSTVDRSQRWRKSVRELSKIATTRRGPDQGGLRFRSEGF